MEYIMKFTLNTGDFLIKVLVISKYILICMFPDDKFTLN